MRAANQVRMRIAVVAAVLAVMTSVAAAQAPGETMSFDREAPPSAVEPELVTVNYRSDVVLADGLSLGAVFLGALGDKEEAAAWGLTGYFLAAPIVHIAHGRGVQALQSFGLRAGLPLLGGWMGYRIGPQDNACVYGAREDGDYSGDGGCGDGGSIGGMLLGGIAGGVTAMIVDAKYLTKYQKRVSPRAWSASIKPTRGGASFGVSGTF
jgi:hypothetical protein